MKRILIIDNESLLIEDLICLLTSPNNYLKRVESGLEGVLVLNNERFDLVIINLSSLEFDGSKIARHVRLINKDGGTVVIGLADRQSNFMDDEFDWIFRVPLSVEVLGKLKKYSNSGKALNCQRVYKQEFQIDSRL